MFEHLYEATKEVLRIALLAAISAFITSLLDQVAKLPPGETTIVLTFILKFVDKVVYEYRKNNKFDTSWKGLMPF